MTSSPIQHADNFAVTTLTDPTRIFSLERTSWHYQICKLIHRLNDLTTVTVPIRHLTLSLSLSLSQCLITIYFCSQKPFFPFQCVNPNYVTTETATWVRLVGLPFPHIIGHQYLSLGLGLFNQQPLKQNSAHVVCMVLQKQRGLKPSAQWMTALALEKTGE